MKKPNFYARYVTFPAVILCILTAAFVFVLRISAHPSPRPEWPEPVLQIWKMREALPLMYLGMLIPPDIVLLAACFAHLKESRWLWENRQDLITSIRLERMGELKQPGLEVFCFPKKKRPAATFRVTYRGFRTRRYVGISPLDPQFEAVMARVDSPAVVRDRHIVKTRIIAAGHRTRTVTQWHARAVRSSFSRTVHSTGLARSESVPGNGLFTFLVYFDDRKPVTEKAWEGTPRCTFLLDKLE